MARAVVLDWRVSGEPARRHIAGGGARRNDDKREPEIDLRIPCEACGVAWAALSAFTYDKEQAMVCYLCPRCGYIEHRVAPASS